EARNRISAESGTQTRVLDQVFKNRNISFRTEATGPSLVVLSQTWYPAWRAYVDREPVKLWRANYAFQALQVPAGIHHVQLVYSDRTFLAGVAASVLGCLVWLGRWMPSFAKKPFIGFPGQ